MELATLPSFVSLLNASRPQRVGEVESVVGLSVQVRGLQCSVGEVVLVGDDPGVPAEVDTAVKYDADIEAFLTQKTDEKVEFDAAWSQLFDLYQAFKSEEAA